ncbi:MAG: sulfatase [Anaerolineae bacterium]|nr:sulfatase-like hydrolase/transferase [Anaerolineae bacterium]MDW8097903.1 sulfatase [Anaerolineae bacterium]
MNVIVIVLDSFRQDHVSFYHSGRPAFEDIPACQTPNLDAFARECIVFDNAYPEALPTIPVRTQLFTGQATLPFRPWQPLTREDISIAEILRAEGYVCGLISDCYHYRAPGMNFHRGFHAYRWVRGQEYDPWTSHPPRRHLDNYVNEHYDATWRSRVAQFLANTDDLTHEEDWFPAKVVDEAIDWLTRNRSHRRIFAWIDSFDPHEPWDPPARFDTYTDPAYRGKRLILPMGGPAERWATPEEIRHIRGLYAGEAAFVDHCLGRLFQALRDLGYYDDSVIVLLADHGHPLADHGKFLKGGDRLHNELLKVPFMIRLPGGQGARRTQAIVQFHDVLPTLLDLLGMAHNISAMHGRSFLPVLRGDAEAHREVIITGYHEAFDRCVRDEVWSYIRRPEGQPDELYHLIEDPRERINRIDDYPEEARRLARAFGSYFYRGIVQAEVKGIQGKYELASGGIS